VGFAGSSPGRRRRDLNEYKDIITTTCSFGYVLLCFDMSKTAMNKEKYYFVKELYIRDEADAQTIFEEFRKKHFKTYRMFKRICSLRYLAGIEVAKVRQS
jgi:hypothetical protein